MSGNIQTTKKHDTPREATLLHFAYLIEIIPMNPLVFFFFTFERLQASFVLSPQQDSDRDAE